ncbi:MAG: hypothetical protein GXP26_10125 [Planctomycetes bacterium]|nr:hypothetical protein [Planctomycetota bacterium]
MNSTNDSLLIALPSQDEISSVVAYVQTVNDLSVTPLYQEGQVPPQIGFRVSAESSVESIEFRVPDPYVLRAALVPFRKIWMTCELSNYFRVRNIFARYMPTACHCYLDFMKQQYQGACQSKEHYKLAAQGSDFTGTDLAASDLIELALNCRMFHSGKNSTSGRYSANDFARFSQEVGPGRFEYMYTLSIYHVGLQATNLMEMAEFFLHELVRLSKTAELAIMPVEVPGTEEFEDNTRILRYSPGYSQIPSAPSEKLSHLLRENRFQIAANFFNFISSNFDDLAPAIVEADNIDDLLGTFGKCRSLKPILERDTEATLLPLQPGVIAFESNGTQIWCSNFNNIEENLLDLKQQLLLRSNWEPQRRPLWKLALQGYGIPFPLVPLTQT